MNEEAAKTIKEYREFLKKFNVKVLSIVVNDESKIIVNSLIKNKKGDEK